MTSSKPGQVATYILSLRPSESVITKSCQKSARQTFFLCPVSPRRIHFPRVAGLIFQLVVVATRESAFVHAITSAGVAFAVTRACAEGSATVCGCDNRHKGPPGEGWKWGGCSEDVEFGTTVSYDFADARENRPDARSAMNRHNNQAGRMVGFQWLFWALLCFEWTLYQPVWCFFSVHSPLMITCFWSANATASLGAVRSKPAGGLSLTSELLATTWRTSTTAPRRWWWRNTGSPADGWRPWDPSTTTSSPRQSRIWFIMKPHPISVTPTRRRAPSVPEIGSATWRRTA